MAMSSPVSPVHVPITASVSAEKADSMPQVGDRVMVESMGLTGYLRFMGTAAFKSGVWAGIELDTPTGKNDGTVAGYVRRALFCFVSLFHGEGRSRGPQTTNNQEQ